MFRSQAKELLTEKDRTELLLSEMLPKSVARQLRLGNNVEAETYETSTIYFSDIVDFNEITLHSEPMQVITLLNSVYNLLDSRIECYDVYKVETIGSVYMVVSGVPVRNGQQHVVEVADMSLDILANIEEQNFSGFTKKIELRIGIHTGPCVAGVVGNKMTRYCLFGDTVNTASRMQSTGSASRIHLSEETHKELKEFKRYNLKKRGTIEIKGKGMMTTYWLVGREKIF
ncbi:hypothetical protein HELRODRAFT_82913 [Helobdella robusta]|uniref:Guanylate cyclase domain-containing protein n=1 Tax=Helobdella robusta TaxID=6412 RepID=T1G4Y1_HELRO|nr:hypothetical protein HELRODRAFT_82913 [Helobdella robusta]ESO00696.1 hypothetical protein HELRODRAFT_82913 [Helobdella robusta]